MKCCLCASEGAALNEPVLYRGSYSKLFAHAKHLGFEGVEIHLRSADDVDAEALLQSSTETGVALCAIATGLAKRLDGLELVDSDEKRRGLAVQRILRQADLAHHFGCHIIIGSMRGNLAPGKAAETRARLQESMLEICDYIQDKNCTVVFEAINRYENNYLNTAAETAAFVMGLASPKVKVLLDTFHMNIEERCLALAIRETGGALGHIHLSDNTRLYPGSGSTNFSPVLRALQELEYQGWLSFEYLPLPDETAAAQRGLAFIRALANCLA